jgi:hypothetical protein
MDQIGGADKIGFDLAQLSFVGVGKPVEDLCADEKPKNGIAQKLDRLVVLRPLAFLFVREGSMREGSREDRSVPKPVTEQVLQLM